MVPIVPAGSEWVQWARSCGYCVIEEQHSVNHITVFKEPIKKDDATTDFILKVGSSMNRFCVWLLVMRVVMIATAACVGTAAANTEPAGPAA